MRTLVVPSLRKLSRRTEPDAAATLDPTGAGEVDGARGVDRRARREVGPVDRWRRGSDILQDVGHPSGETDSSLRSAEMPQLPTPKRRRTTSTMRSRRGTFIAATCSPPRDGLPRLPDRWSTRR